MVLKGECREDQKEVCLALLFFFVGLDELSFMCLRCLFICGSEMCQMRYNVYFENIMC